MIQIRLLNRNPNNASKKPISFGEGKAHLYSDFDRTYLPASHKGFASIPHAEKAPVLRQYFENFRTFLNNTRQGLKFTITTGRNFDEFRTMAELARDRHFPMPLPDNLIVKNGGDEHPKISTDEEFYAGGEYPFRYDQIDTEKQQELKKATGWDGPLIKAKLEEIFGEYNFEIRHPGTTNSADDYGFRSFFHGLNDGFNPKDPSTHHNISPWIVGLRRDGDSKIHITYPRDTHYMEERLLAREDIEGKIALFLKENHIQAYNASNAKGIESGANPATVITPRFQSPSEATPKDLTKLYDTQKAVERAIRENDLVIVAGDSSNDIEMLNIGNYIKLDENTKHTRRIHSEYTELVHQSPGIMVETARQNPKLEEQIRNIPLISIIVRNPEEECQELTSIVNSYGKYGKAIEVQEGHLLDGIKQAIKMHADANPKYKEKLSPDLLQEIYGVEKDVRKKSNHPKRIRLPRLHG